MLLEAIVFTQACLPTWQKAQPNRHNHSLCLLLKGS